MYKGWRICFTSRAQLLEAIDKLAWTWQVHGQVADGLFEDLPCASIQAVRGLEGHVPNSQADYLLLMPLWQGGQTFDWGQLDTTGLAQPSLSGGLNEDNGTNNSTLYSLWKDVSSGLSMDKDHEKD